MNRNIYIIIIQISLPQHVFLWVKSILIFWCNIPLDIWIEVILGVLHDIQ